MAEIMTNNSSLIVEQLQIIHIIRVLNFFDEVMLIKYLIYCISPQILNYKIFQTWK